MPRPEYVTAANYEVHRILYDDGNFSIAWGKWTDNDAMRIAMRWNDAEDDAGYPKAFGKPFWSQLPQRAE